MTRCPSCSAEAPASARFCPECGSALSSVSQMPTGLVSPEEAEAARRRLPSDSPIGRLASSDSIATGGFAPGTMLAERWRIVGLLGRGGMGEVYRADDLKLGAPVALKFLPASLAGDTVRRERFLSEVRLSRQVSHPNVCRVYDVGESEGALFLSMEYVDGEDLSSLLKRIGRLPPDKALEIARQLCAGLAAAHDRGVLHRDLKPANVMLDGRGRVRITDFGLAVAAEGPADGETSGTPSYMAPEQLEGKPASVRSDLYALGLVLYELWTGKKAYDAGTLAQLRGQKRQLPKAPSEMVREMDPAVERVVLRCLEPEPAQRPASAFQVAAALPGGDPLAAAIAAGETPSPEMVAAAGDEEGLSPKAAWTIAGATLLLAAFCAWLLPQAILLDRMGYKKSPEIMRERSREILARLGYAQEPADEASGFVSGRPTVRWILANDSSPERWDRLPDDTFLFWYREAPRPMSPEFSDVMEPVIRIGRRDPPLQESGMALVHLDRDARLERLEVVPPPKDESPGPHAAPDWPALFREAGLDMTLYRAVEPQWTPRTYADARAAWVGPHPNRPSVEGRIEAAAYRGRPVNFMIAGPWNTPALQAPYRPSAREMVGFWASVGTFTLIMLVAFLMARRNLRMGRGDAAGARTVGTAILMASLISWLLGSSHTASPDEIFLALNGFSTALFSGFIVGMVYLALEPYIRRRWPQALVSWSRAISGRWRDPAVGRDILIGLAVLAALEAVTVVVLLLPRWLGRAGGAPLDFLDVYSLAGLPVAVSALFSRLTWAVLMGFFFLFLFTALRAGLKRTWAAAAVLILFNVLTELGNDFGPGWVVAAILWGAAAAFLMTRFGVLSLMAFMWLTFLFGDFPITTDTRAWYFGSGALAFVVLAGVVVWSARLAARGRRALPSDSEAGAAVRA